MFTGQRHTVNLQRKKVFFLIDTYSKHLAKWTTAKAVKIENITREKISKRRKIKRKDTKVKRHISKV